MGNNRAFTAFEATVIATYNKGVLDKDLLSKLMEPYRNTDIDEGGMVGTITNDGLDIYQVVIKTFGHELPKKPDLPSDYKTWSDEQHGENDDYHESVGGLFYEITEQFGWR